MRWWIKCVSMVIAKTASRNVAFKTGVMSQVVLDAQARGQGASLELESPGDDDVERNADLYIFNHEVAQR